jgi:hypothetical protein
MDNLPSPELEAARREESNRGQRAALALEYVGEVIDAEIKQIFDALSNPKTERVEELVSYLRAFTWIKETLSRQKKIGEESATRGIAPGPV